MPRGLLVTAEGIDGSGKSTFARALAERLRAEGLAVETTAEPTSTWLGEAVRRALVGDEPPIVDALLFMADHAAHVPRVKATLAGGAVVVCDRWSDSTFAYQGAALEGVVPDPVRWLRATERPFDLKPDVTFLLDLPVPRALERLAARGRKEKFEEAAFLRRVRRNYLDLAAREPRRFVLLKATRPPEALAEEATAVVLRRRPQPS